MAIQKLNSSSSRNVLLDAVRGIHPDCFSVQKFGFNRHVGTTYETIFNDGGGIYTPPASAVAMSAVSSSASDTMGLLITGLDADWREISETVTLNGLTTVTTTKQFLRINDAQITSGNNVGNITISNNGTQYYYIEATYGIAQYAFYSVPADHTFYLFQVDFTSGTIGSNKYGFARAKMHQDGGAILNFYESTFVTSQLKYDLPIPFKIPEKTDFSLECKSSSSENEISVYFCGILIKE